MCVRKLGPHAGFRARGALRFWGVRASSWIHSFAGGAAKTGEAGSDRRREGRAGREQPDRISQTEEKLVELVLIEKSTDPPPSCCAGAAVVSHVKRLAKNWGFGWG